MPTVIIQTVTSGDISAAAGQAPENLFVTARRAVSFIQFFGVAPCRRAFKGSPMSGLYAPP
jgi:hypothetical protein